MIDKKFKKFKYKYILLFQLLILWELFKMFVRYMNINFWDFLVFKVEFVHDTLLDIVIGMFGGFLYMKFFKGLKKILPKYLNSIHMSVYTQGVYTLLYKSLFKPRHIIIGVAL